MPDAKTFKRGPWRCAVAHCERDAEFSLQVVARTAGLRGVRKIASGPTVRLCRVCCDYLKIERAPLPLAQATLKAIDKLNHTGAPGRNTGGENAKTE